MMSLTDGLASSFSLSFNIYDKLAAGTMAPYLTCNICFNKTSSKKSDKHSSKKNFLL